MLKKILLSSMLSIVATGAFAVSSTVTSKDYVDDLVATKQAKIPAAGATGVGAGETIITYTGAAGTIGERGIYNDASSYDATTDADKIITASALNGAVSNISTTTTSKLTCVDSPTCSLWTISEQTAYGADGANSIDWSGIANNNYVFNNVDATPLSEGSGDWFRLYETWDPEANDTVLYVRVDGISACSTVIPSESIAANQSGVQADYLDNMANAPTSNPIGSQCYCKVVNPTPPASQWVYGQWYDEPEDCAYNCAERCQLELIWEPALFGL